MTESNANSTRVELSDGRTLAFELGTESYTVLEVIGQFFDMQAKKRLYHKGGDKGGDQGWAEIRKNRTESNNWTDRFGLFEPFGLVYLIFVRFDLKIEINYWFRIEFE